MAIPQNPNVYTETMEEAENEGEEPAENGSAGKFGMAGEYYVKTVPLFRRNGYRESGNMIPKVRNRDTALSGLLLASLLA